MNFLEAVESCVLDKYATFSGRASRSEYWYWILFTVLARPVIKMIDIAAFHINIANHHAFYPLYTIFIFAAWPPTFAVLARRLHDTNRSGWWQLISLTIIGIIPLIYWECQKGDEGENQFGNPIPEKSYGY